MIRNNIIKVREDINKAASIAGRDPGEITLVAVTKYRDVPDIEAVLDAGVYDIGENRVAEALKKFSVLEGRTFIKHLIGHLQTNKADRAVRGFDLIHSLDSLKLAGALNAAAEKNGRDVEVLLQINMSGESGKYGIASGDTDSFIESLAEFKRLRLRGLMTMAPLTDDKEAIREIFRKMYSKYSELRESVLPANCRMEILSMGMTNDFRLAVEEGASMIRVGTAIFKGA